MFRLILVVIFVILGSGLCSCTETAILSVPPIKVRQLAQSNKKTAKVLLSIRNNINHPIATIVILNNVFNIIGSIFIGSIATEVLGDAWLGIFSGILTLLIIIFAEIIPKTFGEKYSTAIALNLAIPLQLLTFLFRPLAVMIQQITMPFLRGQKLPTTNEAEIKLLASIGYKEGVIESDEAEMIQRVFQLNDLTAADLMTPRILLTYLDGDLTLKECKEEIINSQHTRILVVEETIDQVLGVVLKSDLLTAIIEGKENQKVNDLIRQVHFVPETVRADKLLKTFQDNREHLMVVLDEYGGVAGVITLEDVLEVLTGEIVDETDQVVDLQEIARKKRAVLLQSRGLS